MAMKYISIEDKERPFVLKVNGQVIKRFSSKSKGLKQFKIWKDNVGDFKKVELEKAKGKDKFILKAVKK